MLHNPTHHPVGVFGGLRVNKSFGISTHCPSTVIANTVVSFDGANVDAQGTGCVLVNNATRP